MNISKNKIQCRFGFTLTEMLIATAIMAVGLVMIATVFPVGVKLTSLSTERSIGSIVADEAFAKVQLYGLRDFIDWPEALMNTAGYADPTEATYYAQSDFLYTLNGVLAPGADTNWGTVDDVFTWVGPDGTLGGGDDTVDNSGIFLNEFRFPSTDISAGEKHRYHWSALCRRVGLKDVQVTVFVTRKSIGGVTYYNYPFNDTTVSYVSAQEFALWPTPIKVNVEYTYANGTRQLEIAADAFNTAYWGNDVYSFFDDSFTIVDHRSGAIYRVAETVDSDGDGDAETIRLWQDWKWAGYPNNPPAGTVVESVWVVPPGVGSRRYPCIGVYQKIIRFDDIN